MVSREKMTEIIFNVIREVLDLKGVSPPAMTLESKIDETLGLESLDWAAVVALLEEKAQVDPFERGLRQDLHTLGDLVDLYFSEINPCVKG